jgi:hypothetical protein
VCGDRVPVGSTLSIGYFNPDELVTTAGRTLQEALSGGDYHTMLIYSCVGRFFALGYDSMKELDQVQKQMEGISINYMAAYAGGELCPVYDKNRKTVNRNHGNSFVICAF